MLTPKLMLIISNAYLLSLLTNNKFFTFIFKLKKDNISLLESINDKQLLQPLLYPIKTFCST